MKKSAIFCAHMVGFSQAQAHIYVAVMQHNHIFLCVLRRQIIIIIRQHVTLSSGDIWTHVLIYPY